MKAKLILKHRGDYDYFLVSRTDNSEALVASLNPDEEIFEQKLSKQNCDSLFGVVDVYMLADKYIKDDVLVPSEKSTFIFAFLNGMELNKDKVFTLEDMKRAFKVGFSNGFASDIISTHKLPEEKEKLFNEFIQSLQQPTEIEVEIEMENYGYCEGCRKAGIWHCAHADTCGYAETRERSKLDSNGYLILKKI